MDSQNNNHCIEMKSKDSNDANVPHSTAHHNDQPQNRFDGANCSKLTKTDDNISDVPQFSCDHDKSYKLYKINTKSKKPYTKSTSLISLNDEENSEIESSSSMSADLVRNPSLLGIDTAHDGTLREVTDKGLFTKADSINQNVEFNKLQSLSTSVCVNTEQSDSDDYRIKYNTNNDDDNMKQRCDDIRKDITHDYIKFKWKKLLKNRLFYSRILTCILTVLLLFVSTVYCIAQMCRTELDLITSCDPKKREEIWAHSGEVNMKSDNPGKITIETHYGYTDEPCWTTKEFEINTQTLWYRNKYTYRMVNNPINGKMILFALMSLYCLVMMFYIVIETVKDIIDIKKNILHKKSNLYNYQSTSNAPKNRGESIWLNYFRKMKAWYSSHMTADTSVWITMMLINESVELVLQSQALLLYNGYHIFDKNHNDDVYLSNKPDLIIAFSAVITFNGIGCGLCWILYALIPHKCRGLTFKLVLFYVDEISDLFYSLFPFVIIFSDDYNDFKIRKSEDILMLMAQLNITSGLSFIATFIPLFFLCNKCLFISINAVRKMRDQYYNQWKFIQSVSSQSNNALIAYHARLKGFKNQQSFMNTLNKKEIYDPKGKIQLNVRLDTQLNIKPVNIDKSKKALLQTFGLVFMSLLYMIAGILILIYTTKHAQNATNYCYQIDEHIYFNSNGTFMYNITLSDEEKNLLKQNPELFVWDHCLYKVYPFTNNDEYKCQCRVFMINWGPDFPSLISNVDDRHKYLNITQSDILNGMLKHWYMLEKVSTYGVEDQISSVDPMVLTSNMFKAFKMKAFSWISMPIDGIEEGISLWSDLEYFNIENTFNVHSLPSDFKQLNSLKYFRSISGGLQEFPEQLCSLHELKVIYFQYEDITTIPHCVMDLKHLAQFVINGCVSLYRFPISLLSLPNLLELSLWHGSITLNDTLLFNNITNTSEEALELYFDSNFEWNTDTTYYLSGNPICDEINSSVLPNKLEMFLDEKLFTCNNPCGSETILCPPNVVGDGKCDHGCCLFDLGDCMQLCFSEEFSFSNCTWDLYTNDQCDPECDNDYCRENGHLTSFEDGVVLGWADNWNCRKSFWGDFEEASDWELCIQSRDDNIYTNHTCGHGNWMGDGICDDSCRTTACLDDLGDCDRGCFDGLCEETFTIWNYKNSLQAEEEQNLWNNEELCTFFPLAQHAFGFSDVWICENLTANWDLNYDGYMNFREFVMMIFQVRLTDPGWYTNKSIQINSNEKKWLQVNCSSCVGAENYNTIYQP